LRPWQHEIDDSLGWNLDLLLRLGLKPVRAFLFCSTAFIGTKKSGNTACCSIFAPCLRKQDRTGLAAEAGRFEVFIQELFEFVMDGELLFFAAFFFKAKQKPFP
jgi:hypothetical protein